jgi:hypothetical protein
MAQPTKSEKDAAAAALQEKKDALASIRQDVFARSQGLRGAASLYDFAGRTPHLAADPVAGRVTPPPVTPPQPPVTPGLPGGRNPQPGDPGYNPFPVGTGRGPPGDRGTGPVLGGAPKNTGQVPGGPAANTVIGGAPANTGLAPVTTAQNPTYTSTVNQARAQFGLKPIATPTAPTASATFLPAGAKALGVSKPLTIIPTQQPAMASTAPPVNTGASNQGMVDAARAKLGLKPLAPTAATYKPPATTAPTPQSILQPQTAKLGGTPPVAPSPVRLAPTTPPAPPPTTAKLAPVSKLAGIVRSASIIPQPNRGAGGNR